LRSERDDRQGYATEHAGRPMLVSGFGVHLFFSRLILKSAPRVSAGVGTV
jgi:hypothetical protein